MRLYSYIKIILALLFLIGGLLQTFGLGSVTAWTIIINVLMAFYVLISIKRFPRLTQKNLLGYFLSLGVLYLGIGIQHGNSPSYIGGYLLFALIPMTTFAFVNSIGARGDRLVTIINRFLAIILVVQFPVLLLQNVFGSQIAQHAHVTMISADANYGTFFVKSDVTIGFFSSMVLFNSLIIKKRSVLSLQPMIAMCNILLTSSKMSIIVAVGILILSMARRPTRRNILVSLTYIAIALGVFVVAFFNGLTIPDARSLTDNIDTDAILLAASEGRDVARYATIVYILNSNLSLFGNGLFYYFDPIGKSWAFYGGASLIYSLYLDTGLIGLTGALLVIGITTFRMQKRKGRAAFIFILFILFSVIHLTLLDIGFMFIFFWYSFIFKYR